jgi:hypothetical protein
MCGLLAPVVRKGFNFESILCGLSTPVFGIGPLGCIYTFWNAETQCSLRRLRGCSTASFSMVHARQSLQLHIDGEINSG